MIFSGDIEVFYLIYHVLLFPDYSTGSFSNNPEDCKSMIPYKSPLQ
jgi:hypothetical protein